MKNVITTQSSANGEDFP